jgi:type I thyroxine 5'-deiodinase
LFDEYRNRIGFYVVYILEAHPTDLWQMAANERDGVLFRSPRTTTERTETASACVRNLGIRIPALLDGIDNRTERAYTAWPDRIYLIGQDGRIIFKTRPGPYGFSAKGLDKVLRGLGGERSARNTAVHPGHG